jgi:hypothetical protein
VDVVEIVALVVCVGWVLFSEWNVRRSNRALIDVERSLGEESRLVIVSGDTYRSLDLAWYRKLQRDLESAGWRFAGDYTEPAAKNIDAFVRCMISPDETTTFTMAHVRFTGWMKLAGPLVGGTERRILECSTELSDGAYLETENLLDAPLLDPAPHIERELLPADTDCRTLASRHAARLSERLRRHPNVACVAVHSFEDVLASRARCEARRAAHRRTTGLKRTELVALAPKWDRQGAVETYAALVAARARERADRDPPQ